MKVTIDDQRCQGHARCVTICPDVFGMDDDGKGRVLESVVPERLRDEVDEAVLACPESAITTEG